MSTITISRATALQALAAMDKTLRFMHDEDYVKLNHAIDTFKAALAQHHDDVAIANPRGGGVIYKTSAAATDAAIRAKLVELGWTPPTALAPQQQEPPIYEGTASFTSIRLRQVGGAMRIEFVNFGVPILQLTHAMPDFAAGETFSLVGIEGSMKTRPTS